LPPVSDGGPVGRDAVTPRLRRVIVTIFAVQLLTMLGLWALSVVFGA
jgi:hypothetical protein